MIAPPPKVVTEDQIKKLLELLGYTDDPDYICQLDGNGVVQPRYVLDVAFNKIGVVGALCPRSTFASGGARYMPVIYVVVAESPNDADDRHRAIWSQSVVPQILMMMPEGIQIRNGYDYRQAGEVLPWSIVDVGDVHKALVPLTSRAVRSSVSWKDYSIENRVDSRIANDIRNLCIKISKDHSTMKHHQGVLIALIGKMLYLYILLDRKIISQEWVDGIADADGTLACPDIHLDEGYGPDRRPPTQWPIDQIWALLDAIDEILNGAIFPIPNDMRPLVTTEVVHLIRRALRADEINSKGEQQFSFLDVDYSTIRTETISTIYECFFELHGDGERRRHGAYYTPSFLVDYIVQEADRVRPLTAGAIVVDPACGSGAFLVASYRHILEHERCRVGGLNVNELSRILRDCICGIELKKQAADVARFSLCLTMLDYLPGRSIESLQLELQGKKLFPEQAEVILHQNAFDPLPEGRVRTATHVMGNPPWTKADIEGPVESFRLELFRILNDQVVDNDSFAEYFYWHACHKLAEPDAVIAFVMPTKCFVAPSARHFPDAVARRSRIRGIANLTSFRRRLFPDTEEAATILFAMPGIPEPLEWAWRFSPRLASQPVGPDGRPWAIVIDRGQVEKFRLGELTHEDHHWYRDFFLQPLDRYIASCLEVTAGSSSLLNVREFLKASGMHASVGESPDRASSASKYILGTSRSNDFRVALGLRGKDDHDIGISWAFDTYDFPDDAFEGLPERLKRMYRGPMVLMPRSQSGAYVVGRAAYNSSIQGIYFVDDTVPMDCQKAVLHQFVLYMETAVGRYLLSLFGRQWIADQRRFETPDLMRLPFPYQDYRELLAQPVDSFMKENELDQTAFAKFAAKKFGLSSIFVNAILEHRDLREPFQNGKRASSATEPVNAAISRKYRSAMKIGLSELLEGTPFTLRALNADLYHREMRIVLSDDPKCKDEDRYAPQLPDIGQETAVELYDYGDYAIARLIKSSVKTAWTVERAFADALAVANSIMSE